MAEGTFIKIRGGKITSIDRMRLILNIRLVRRIWCVILYHEKNLPIHYYLDDYHYHSLFTYENDARRGLLWRRL